MGVDYAAVAGSVVLGVPGVRACLVVSPDGLPLAVYPPGEEEATTNVWSRLATLGQVTRGFVTVRSEVWAFVQGERCGALVVAERSVRPGQVLEYADQVLADAAAAEVLAGADRRTGVGAQSGGAPQREAWDRGAAVRRFRVPLHREARQVDPDPQLETVAYEPVVSLEDSLVAETAAAGPESALAEPVAAQEDRPSEDGQVRQDLDAPQAADPVEHEEAPADEPATRGLIAAPDPAGSGRARGEVDIIALAREFAGLLSDREDQ